jgi:RND superfamily putative drug exporter
MFQQMGFGLAVAVLIDATVVRTIIVPAAMELLGERNWYLPRWLRWIPNVSVEGHRHEPAAPKEPRRPRHEPGIAVPRPSLEGAEH